MSKVYKPFQTISWKYDEIKANHFFIVILMLASINFLFFYCFIFIVFFGIIIAAAIIVCFGVLIGRLSAYLHSCFLSAYGTGSMIIEGIILRTIFIG